MEIIKGYDLKKFIEEGAIKSLPFIKDPTCNTKYVNEEKGIFSIHLGDSEGGEVLIRVTEEELKLIEMDERDGLSRGRTLTESMDNNNFTSANQELEFFLENKVFREEI